MKHDPIQLIEYGMNMAKAKPGAHKTEKTEKKEKPPSLEDMWVAEVQRRAKFDEFMKIMKKQNAEEKKKTWSVDHIAMFLLALTPINWAVLYVLLK